MTMNDNTLVKGMPKEKYYRLFACIDCKKHTDNDKDWYFLRNELWDSLGGGEGMLCIDCLEKRLKRKVTKSDFDDVAINQKNKFIQSLPEENDMIEIVINKCAGGFSLSEKATVMICEKDPNILDHADEDSFRASDIVLDVVKALGSEGAGEYAKLKIVKIPSNVEWEISEHDGCESVCEKHRKWS